MNTRKLPPGVVIYDGPSQLDGKPIICIATLSTSNTKTGDMVQTWILCRNDSPTVSAQHGLDISICGDCIHRGSADRPRSCYVSLHQAPLSIYKAFFRGNYPHVDKIGWQLFDKRDIRLGAYGDPAAVPMHVWDRLAEHADNMTGYTHQWRHTPLLSKYCMASVDTAADYRLAKILGWRTFRVSLDADTRIHGEALCPASEQAGYKLTCKACKACDGHRKNKRGDVVIQVHGSKSKINSFTNSV